jgi:hypothetical protein
MKTRILRMLGWLAALTLAACAANHSKPAPPGKVTPQLRSGTNALRAYQVEDWIAPDDHTLVMNAMDRSLYEARFKGTCTGLRLVDTIAFIVPGSLQIETYVGIVLPDGRQCLFKSLTRLAAPPSHDKDAKPEG